MKIESAIQEDHQVKLTVELEPETFEKSKQRAAKSLAKRVKIPGFRPGKAPYHMVQRHVGDGAIIEEAIDLILKDEYPKIIEEADIDPYGPGSLVDIPNLEPPTFEFVVPLVPEVTLNDHRALRIDYKPREVGQADIDKVIGNLRDQQAVIEPAERAAQEGDMVYVVLSGERTQPDEGQEAALFSERRYPAIIEGKDVDDKDEWPFPGFSRNLIGLSADDEKTLEHTFAKDYSEEELQGVTASFSLKVEEIKARTLPELNDEFAKSVANGEYETLDALIDDIRSSLEDNFNAEDESDYESEIVDQLVDGAEIKYPPQMLEHELEHLLEDLNRELAYQGMDIELYLKSRDIDMEALHEELKPTAEKRIKRGLVLMEIGNQEEINVTTQEIERQVTTTLQQIRAIYPEEDASRLTSGEALQGLVSRIMSDEITKRTLERLRKIAMGVDIEAELAKEKEEAEAAAAAAAEAAQAEADAAAEEAAGDAGETAPADEAASKNEAASGDEMAVTEEMAHDSAPVAETSDEEAEVSEAPNADASAADEPATEAVEAPAAPSDESDPPTDEAE